MAFTPIASVLLAALAVPSFVDADEPPGLAVERKLLSFRTGDHVWIDEGASTGPVRVVISVPMQMAFVYRGPTLIGASTVSTGKRGKTTPVGEYAILQKRTFHRSNLYNNAPMPFMQRLTWSGIAIHAGDLPGFPASHGCVRVPTAFARRLFDATALGSEVAVVNDVIAFPAHRSFEETPALAVGSLPDPTANVVTAGGKRFVP